MIRLQVLTKNEASQVLSQPDEYTNNLNPFSLMAMRLRSSADYLRTVENTTLEFTENEIRTLNTQIDEVNNALNALGLNIDLEISFAKTQGLESMGMPYSRHNAVVLTAPYLHAFNSGMRIPNVNMGTGIVAHEIFHIISRSFPQLRAGMYNIWNFYYEPELRVPLQVIINPDAPNCNYKVNVIYQGREISVTPMILVQEQTQMGMMNADKKLYFNGQAIHRDSTNYMEVTGAPAETSAYHPEEISAEAFRLIIEGADFQRKDRVLEVLRLYFS